MALQAAQRIRQPAMPRLSVARATMQAVRLSKQNRRHPMARRSSTSSSSTSIPSISCGTATLPIMRSSNTSVT